MAEKKKCEVCGEKVDARGLSGHMMTHAENEPVAVADGGEPQGDGVTVDRDDLSDGTVAAVENEPGVDVTDDAITFRTINEIEVADPEMKRELLEELKEHIRGTSLRV